MILFHTIVREDWALLSLTSLTWITCRDYMAYFLTRHLNRPRRKVGCITSLHFFSLYFCRSPRPECSEYRTHNLSDEHYFAITRAPVYWL